MMKTHSNIQRRVAWIALLCTAILCGSSIALAEPQGVPAPTSAAQASDASSSWQNVQAELSDKLPYLPRFWGRMHPLLVHLPIGLILAAGLLELLLTRRTPRASPSALAALGIGLLGVALAASSGWLNAELEPQSRSALDTIFLHRWVGVTTAGLALLSLIFGRLCLKRDSAGILTIYRTLLLLACVSVAYGGHLGGSLVHGDGYLWSVFDEKLPDGAGSGANTGPSTPRVTEPEPDDTPLDALEFDPLGDELPPERAPAREPPPEDDPLAALLEDAAPRAEPRTNHPGPDYVTEVRPIFEANCFRCHGERKQKGRLRLDRRESVFRGPEAEWVIQPGRPDDSLVVQLVSLPADSLDLMPGDGDPLAAADIETIRRWIAAGAQWPESADAQPEAGAEDRAQGDAPREPSAEAAAAQLALEPAEVAATLARLDAAGQHALRIAETDPRVEVNLSLAGQTTGDAEVAALSGLGASLAWLNLGRTSVTDAGVRELAQFSALERLHLERTQIGDASLATIADLHGLEYLNLYGTRVSDAGLAHLEGLEHLRHLYLWNSAATAAGVERLRAALPDCEIVFEAIELAAVDPEPTAEPVAHELAGCCAAAVAAGKTCDHPCCIEASARGEICPTCAQ